MLVLITTVKTEDRVACGKTFFGSRDWKVLISGWSLSKGVLDQTVLCLKKKNDKTRDFSSAQPLLSACFWFHSLLLGRWKLIAGPGGACKSWMLESSSPLAPSPLATAGGDVDREEAIWEGRSESDDRGLGPWMQWIQTGWNWCWWNEKRP